MDFDFTDDQNSLRDAVARWVEKDFGFERRHALAKGGGKTRDVYGELAGLGLTALAAAGWQGEFAHAAVVAPLAGTYFNMRKTTIYGGSNEVQRNIVAQTLLA